MTEQESFIKKLSILLEEKNITQRELAEKINVTEVTISRYLSGERSPRIEIVNKIADFFNVSIDYLLGVSDIRNPVVDAYTDALERQIIRNAGKEELVIGLSRESKGLLTDEDKAEITKFAEYVANRRKEGK